MTRRKDGRWVKKVDVGGQYKYFYSSKKTEREAERDITQQMLHYISTEKSKYLFENVAASWNTEYRERKTSINYRKGTSAVYERTVKFFSGRHIEDVGAPEANAFINSLAKKGYSMKTVAAHKNILNMIFVYALCEGYIRYNPIPDIKIPSGLPKTNRKMPTTDEIKIIESHHENFDLLPFFLLFSGLRKSEALAITRDSIDFKNKLIKVRNHVIHDGNRPVFEPVLKTESAERDVILLDRLAEAIPKNFSGFLFSMNGDGKDPLTKCAFDKRWKSYCREHGLNITAHMLRHGFATMLFEAGIDEKDAQELMGHSDITLTREIYTHIRSERKQETAVKLNNFSF